MSEPGTQALMHGAHGCMCTGKSRGMHEDIQMNVRERGKCMWVLHIIRHLVLRGPKRGP